MLTMKLTVEYLADFVHAGHKLTGQDALLFLQAGSVQMEGVNETRGLCHISST
jgi:hypothetical protein